MFIVTPGTLLLPLKATIVACLAAIFVHAEEPLDEAAIARAAADTGAIVVSEEHLVDGGLGVKVAQVAAKTHPCVMEFVGIENTYAESATPEQLLEKYGLTAAHVAVAARRAVSRKKR